MSEENIKPKKLSLSGSGKLTLGGGGLEQTTLRGAMASGRGKNVQVEVRRKRILNPALRSAPSVRSDTVVPNEELVETQTSSAQSDDHLTAAERANRIKVLREDLSKTQAAPSKSGELQKSETQNKSVEKSVDPRESRRRVELAELEEIEKRLQLFDRRKWKG